MQFSLHRFARSPEALALVAGMLVLAVPFFKPGAPQYIVSVSAALMSLFLAIALYRSRTTNERQQELISSDSRKHRNFQLRHSRSTDSALRELLRLQVETHQTVTTDHQRQFQRRTVPLRLAFHSLRIHTFLLTRDIEFFAQDIEPNSEGTAELMAWAAREEETAEQFRVGIAPDVTVLLQDISSDAAWPDGVRTTARGLLPVTEQAGRDSMALNLLLPGLARIGLTLSPSKVR